MNFGRCQGRNSQVDGPFRDPDSLCQPCTATLLQHTDPPFMTITIAIIYALPVLCRNASNAEFMSATFCWVPDLSRLC